MKAQKPVYEHRLIGEEFLKVVETEGLLRDLYVPVAQAHDLLTRTANRLARQYNKMQSGRGNEHLVREAMWAINGLRCGLRDQYPLMQTAEWIVQSRADLAGLERRHGALPETDINGRGILEISIDRTKQLLVKLKAA